MEPLNIKSTEDTPKVIFDPFKEIFEISGRSLPEDVNLFYKPILEWIRSYLESPNQKTVFIVNLQYFNTASSKILVEIFNMLDDKYNEGYEILVKWFSVEEDEDIIDAGEEFAENVEVPFELIIEKE